MNYLMYFRRLLALFAPKPKPIPKISILIPFSSVDPERTRNLRWLIRYYRSHLPDAEIIIGRSRSKVFCKGEALNNAAKKAKGKVFVMLDADCYINTKTIEDCANKILDNLDNHLWFVPYRRLYRLTREISEQILASSPKCPLRLPSPPPPCYYDNSSHSIRYGHRYGAMIMIFPREALDALGCFDERFKGWGGEDVAFVRAVDTLYGKHKTVDGDVYHLWHPFIGENYKTRKWDGQEKANANHRLASRYNRANRHPSKMRRLVDEGCALIHKHRRRRRHKK